MERIYLDYNATAPLDGSFASALAAGAIPFANPSSQHSSGKKAHQYIEQVKEQLYNFFGLSSKNYDLIFHSGATEAANTILNQQNCEHLVYFTSDHPCVTNLEHPASVALKIDQTGHFNLAEVEKNLTHSSWLHYTYVHNETGKVWSLEKAWEIKSKTGCHVYVDATQMVGKIENQKLVDGLDVYSFSGHKFGALKGIGFSFYLKSLKIAPLIRGGSQQKGLRSGTLNLHGIASIKSALENTQYSSQLNDFKLELIEFLASHKNLTIISGENNNTITVMHETLKADILLIHFDLAGLDVSSGSACASGSLRASATLEVMGYGELAKHNIRISLGVPHLAQKDVIIERLKLVMEKL